VVDLLIFIHLSEVFILDIAGPKHIPVAIPLDHLEASILEGIYYSVIDMSGVADSERHE
jgi:hypothetical protein